MKSVRKYFAACFSGLRKAEVARNEAMLRAILEHLPVGIWIIHADGKIVHANPEANRIWGGARYDSILEQSYKAWFVDSGKKTEVTDGPNCVSLRRSRIQEVTGSIFDYSYASRR